MTTSKKTRPLVLIILDGLGNNPNPMGNAVYHGSKPVLDGLNATCPVTELVTWGERVGLPKGQMGNSEVGHLNIGGGRIVRQELTRINQAVAEKKISCLPDFQRVLERAKQNPESALHLIGLVSQGGVHSSLDQIKALVEAAVKGGVKHVFIHAITDGRDRPPTAAIEEVAILERCIDHLKTELDRGCSLAIASIIGRYYAMDRDKRWERMQKAYDLWTKGEGEVFDSSHSALAARKESGAQDEFLEPIKLGSSGCARSPWISEGDQILFCNFRADRMRQTVTAFLAQEAGLPEMKLGNRPNLSGICTLTEYDPSYPVDVLFRPEVVKNHLGEVLATNNLTQLRIAETEKYPHVTYFFNGGVETPCKGEERIMIPSPRDVPTYDYKPEMSAHGVTEALIKALNTNKFDVAIVNFANCDMVGHTGVFEAAKKAVETVDTCLGEVLKTVESLGGAAIVTADHGNAEQMVDYQTGEPHTFHTTYPVPLILVGESVKDLKLRSGGALCDIAPTILHLLGVEQPEEMTGESLVVVDM